jgi:hypothetical protein
MPNISFDIFFDQDFINVTATRGRTAPKAKPEWKVRSAPKLPPKPAAPPEPGSVRPPQRPKINEADEKVTDVSDAGSQTADKPKRKPPKLGPRKSAAPTTNGETKSS